MARGRPPRIGVTPEAPTRLRAARPAGDADDPSHPLDEILDLYILVPDVVVTEAPADENARDDFDAARFARLLARSTRSAATPLMIARFRNARVHEPFRTSQGEAGARWRRLIAMHRRLKGHGEGAPGHGALPADAELREYGRLLFSTLLPGQVRRLYDAARAELRDRRLDICLTSTIGWVADMPWELAFDPDRQVFLCMEDVNLFRNVSTAVPAEAIAPRARPLRILIVAAQPLGAGALSVHEEQELIRRGFRPLVDSRSADIEVVARVTPERLHQLLSRSDAARRPWDVLHFIGHGEYDRPSGFGYLIFEDQRRRPHALRADYFRQIVARRGLRLVFLNACETGMGLGRRRPLDFAMGAAPMLVAGGVPAVVANQFKVLDPSAMAFAGHFYWALGQGRTIGDAAREARVAVNYAASGERIDWAVPIVFARNPGDRLTVPSPAPAPRRSPAAAAHGAPAQPRHADAVKGVATRPRGSRG